MPRHPTGMFLSPLPRPVPWSPLVRSNIRSRRIPAHRRGFQRADLRTRGSFRGMDKPAHGGAGAQARGPGRGDLGPGRAGLRACADLRRTAAGPGRADRQRHVPARRVRPLGGLSDPEPHRRPRRGRHGRGSRVQRIPVRARGRAVLAARQAGRPARPGGRSRGVLAFRRPRRPGHGLPLRGRGRSRGADLGGRRGGTVPPPAGSRRVGGPTWSGSSPGAPGARPPRKPSPPAATPSV